MKFVQSVWSKAAMHSGGWHQYHGHWPSPRYHWCSWVLSSCWAQKHYGNLELITDNAGAHWLVDQLKLPFTSVRTDLEKINVSPRLWAYGKIVAYSLQQEPFFHIDGDVFLMGKLPAKYESADLVCQFFEQGPHYPNFEATYDHNRKEIEKVIPRLPSFWRFMNEASAGNCGIFGGANLDAVGRYTRDVIELVTHPDNASGWKHVRMNVFGNCVIEQQALWCSAREQNVPLTPLFQNTDFADVDTFRRKALELHFNHVATAKIAPVGEHLEQRVRQEYPEQFQIIQRLAHRTL